LIQNSGAHDPKVKFQQRTNDYSNLQEGHGNRNVQ
jgi:hypothetical protein